MSRFESVQRRMLEGQLIKRGIRDVRVLGAMQKVPRHRFVEEALQEQAYGDHALPIGERQTISQPYMVGLMTEALRLEGHSKVLEIGTGSGYQTAVLAELAHSIYSVERIRPLLDQAHALFKRLDYHNIHLRLSDGSLGWDAEAPFDAILVTAGAPEIPAPLLAQLKPGGRMVIPVGSRSSQALKQVVKEEEGLLETTLTPCVFVPLLGECAWREDAEGRLESGPPSEGV